MDEFDVEELVHYINAAKRVTKHEGFDENEMFVKALQALLPRSLDLDTAIERVRRVVIDMGIVEGEE